MILKEYLSLKKEYFQELKNILIPAITTWILTNKSKDLLIKDKYHRREYYPAYIDIAKGYVISQYSGGNVRYSAKWGLINTLRCYHDLKPFGDAVLDLNLEYYLKYCEFIQTKLRICQERKEVRATYRELLIDLGCTKLQLFDNLDNLDSHIYLPLNDFKAYWRNGENRHIKDLVPEHFRVYIRGDFTSETYNSYNNRSRYIDINFDNFSPIANSKDVVITGN